MALLTPDQSNPLGSVPSAMMKGLEMRQMMMRQLDQHNELQQRMAQQQQTMSAQDIMNRMSMQQYSRPVNDDGTVTDTVTPPPAAPQQQAPAATRAPAPAQNYTPANASPVPQQPAPVAQAAPIAQAPQTITRKVDPKRQIQYTDSTGKTITREILTPEEQIARQGAAKQAMDKATGIKFQVHTDATDPKSPLQDVYIQPNEIAEFLKQQAGQQQVTMQPDGSPPATLPISALPSTVRYIDSQAATRARVGINDATNTSKEGIAEGRNNASEDNAQTRANATTAAAGTRANATTAAAAIRANAANNPRPATAGQNAVQARATQRELDRIDTEENGDGMHAGQFEKRTQLGQILRDGKDPDAKDPTAPISAGARTMIQNRLKGLTDSLQNLQLRKAKLNGMAVPPFEVVTGTAEGKTSTTPDGHTWAKRDGILYFVK